MQRSPLVSVRLMLVLLMMLAMSCEVAAPIEESYNEQIQQAQMAMAAEPNSVYNLKYVVLKISAQSMHFNGTLTIQIRNASGDTILANAYELEVSDEMYLAAIPYGVNLVEGTKYRIYVSRTVPGTPNDVVKWKGTNPVKLIDEYAPGGASAKGDFGFELYGDDGGDQRCEPSGPGTILDKGTFEWQEFIPKDKRRVLTKVNLGLNTSLDWIEDVTVDILDMNNNILAVSEPVSTANLQSPRTSFTFATPPVLFKGEEYKIRPRRSWYSVFPFQGVFWAMNDQGGYRYGHSVFGQPDFDFATYSNGFIDEQFDVHYGSSPIFSDPQTTPWQSFTAGGSNQ